MYRFFPYPTALFKKWIIIEAPRAIVLYPFQLAFQGKLKLEQTIPNVHNSQVCTKLPHRPRKLFGGSLIIWPCCKETPKETKRAFLKNFSLCVAPTVMTSPSSSVNLMLYNFSMNSKSTGLSEKKIIRSKTTKSWIA